MYTVLETEAFVQWVDAIKDMPTRIRLRRRVNKARLGNLGDVKPLGNGVWEMREFGLHALFVTPNKELRLLRQHTRSAVLVHRVGRQATMASLRWEELHARANRRRDGQEAPAL